MRSINKWPYDIKLTELFDYIQDTGLLVWRHRPESMFSKSGFQSYWNRRYAGKEALSKCDKDGYKTVTVFGRSFRVHRLVYMFHNDGACPDFVDHVDTDISNNRIENLREASKQENGWNRPKNKNNTSGYKGVSIIKKTGRYKATIFINGKNKYIGSYATAEEAHEAYCSKLKTVADEFYHP